MLCARRSTLARHDQPPGFGFLQVVAADPGDRICRTGAPSNFWFGVIDGLLKMSNVSRDGHQITYTGLRCSIRCSNPGVGQLLRITQQELAWLVGLSRQRVNQALIALQARG